jgi:sulfite reductase (ferredoxin)
MGSGRVDGHEPLNKNEIDKAEDNGLNVRARIETIYCQAGILFDRLRRPARPLPLVGPVHPAQARNRRRPHREARTARARRRILHAPHPHRRRASSPLEQLRVIADISNEFARGTADLTDRQNIQLHWVEIESVPRDLAPPRSRRTCRPPKPAATSPASSSAHPVAGIAADELIDPTPAIEEISRRYIGDPSHCRTCRANTRPRSPATPARTSSTRSTTAPSIAVEHPEHGVGYDLWVGGALSVVPRFAERLGAWVAPDQVVDTWLGVTQIFRDYGYRRLRNKARHEVPARRLGPGEVPRGPRNRIPRLQARRRPGTGQADHVAGDHVGVHKQKPTAATTSASTLIAGRASGTLLGQLGRPRREVRHPTRSCAPPRTRRSCCSTSTKPKSMTSSPSLDKPSACPAARTSSAAP